MGLDVEDKGDWMDADDHTTGVHHRRNVENSALSDLRHKKPEASRVGLRFDAFHKGSLRRSCTLGPLLTEGTDQGESITRSR